MSEESYDFNGKRVFLSGPMTGMPGWNRAAFDEAERRLLAAGAADVFNPAFLAPAEGEEPDSHEGYMLRTLHGLTEWTWEPGMGVALRVPEYDCIALLPGWERSRGACVEMAVAEACGIEAVEI